MYSAAQIPLGALLDKYGSRVLLVTGSLVMGVGQVVMALSTDLTMAIGARILVGAGDACMFSAALRLIPFWFPAHRVPILQQLTGLIGQVGQMFAVVALLPAIRNFGWTSGMLGAAAASLVMAACCLFIVRNTPSDDVPAVDPVSFRELNRIVVQVIKHPSAQLGFWVHFTSGFFVNVFLTMWGMPYLLDVQDLEPGAAELVFSLAVLGGLFFGPVFGHLTARHPLRRSNLALMAILPNLGLLSIVLLLPHQAPYWLLLLWALAISAGGPGTGIGFDFPRTSLPHARLGAANGVVLSGSFSGGTLCLLAMAVALQLMTGGGDPTAAHLTWAMAIAVPFFLVGLIGIFWTRVKLRRLMAEQGIVVPTWRQVVKRIRQQRRRI